LSASRPPAPESRPPASGSGYGRGARILSIGIATTGVVTLAYFALAAHALSPVEYKRISLVWSIMFVVASVIYRPIEQLLSRTIADRRARGHSGAHNLRVALLIQGAFALAFLAIALALRDLLQNDLFDGSEALYWVLVVGVLAYAASYFARGFLAGHQRFELYGLLVFLEAISRVLFALAVVIGIASGQRSAWPSRRSCRCSSCRGSSRAARRPMCRRTSPPSSRPKVE
jgi:O-antigen/teichoic acid export membrane protein